MGVGDEDVGVDRPVLQLVTDEPVPQPPDARAGVYDDEPPAAADLEAGRIAAESHGIRAGHGH